MYLKKRTSMMARVGSELNRPIAVRMWSRDKEMVSVFWREGKQVRCVRLAIFPFVDRDEYGYGTRRIFAVCMANGLNEALIIDATYVFKESAQIRLQNEVKSLIRNPREI